MSNQSDALTMAMRLYGESDDTFAPETFEVMKRWRPKVEAVLRGEPEPPAGPTFKDGVEAAAKYTDDKADCYDAEHGTTDPETGTREYPGRGAGEDYYNTLRELADEIRGIQSQQESA